MRTRVKRRQGDTYYGTCACGYLVTLQPGKDKACRKCMRIWRLSLDMKTDDIREPKR